eukprot:scaffold8714_cov88-Cylindrotheca_fusiformis.AAC.2
MKAQVAATSKNKYPTENTINFLILARRPISSICSQSERLLPRHVLVEASITGRPSLELFHRSAIEEEKVGYTWAYRLPMAPMCDVFEILNISTDIQTVACWIPYKATVNSYWLQRYST